MAAVGWATWKYPSFVNRVDSQSSSFMRATRFLFLCYQPHGYTYSCVLLGKNLFVCLVPVVFAGDGGLQILGLSMFLFFFIIYQQQMNPWRTWFCNILDGLINLIIILILIAGAVATPLDTNIDAVSGVCMFFFTVCAIVIAIPLSTMFYARYCRNVANDVYFICHVKANAAAQVQYLKIMFEEKTGRNIYVDNNDTSKMTATMDVLRNSTDTLIVYLTEGTLTKPWCVAEIALAVSKGVKVTTVKTSSFAPPGEQQMKDLLSYIELGSTSLLSVGVDLAAVEKAFVQILSPDTPCIEMDESLKGSAKLKDLFTRLSGGQSGEKASSIPDTSGLVALSVDSYDDEAVAVGSLLQHYTEASQKVCCLADYDLDMESVASLAVKARCVIVVLSHDTLTNLRQLSVIINVMDTLEQAEAAGEDKMALIPVVLPSFRYPTEKYYESVLPAAWPYSDGARVQSLLDKFFKMDAILYPNLGSTEHVSSHIQKIKDSIPTKFSLERAASRQTVSRSMKNAETISASV